MNNLDMLIPRKASVPDIAPRWATVTGTSPMTVRFDGESLSVPAVSIEGNLSIGNRVWTILANSQVVIVGKYGGTTVDLSAYATIASLAGYATDAELTAGLATKQAAGSYAAASHTHTLANISDFPSAVSATELGYLDGVTSGIQSQINGKAATSHTHTVSQITDIAANYMPTYGSNSNGNYTRFPDGTQICSWETSITPVANSNTGKTWTFPVAFIAAPVVSVIANTTATAVQGTYFSSPTATSVSLRIVRSNTTSTDLHALAYGRWK